jgi:peptidoglycan/LPS O-acetylase OafA/YrhL
MERKKLVTVIEPLRALAALAVCWFHFTNGAQPVTGGIETDWLRSSGSFGWLGVSCFFVISGFVIPLSMYSGRFQLSRDWKIFFGKRILRLDPPYILSILMNVGLLYLGTMLPSSSGQTPNVSAVQLLAHLGYLNAFLNYGWLNDAYWTLAIEFQYYVLIAFCYAAIVSKAKIGNYLATIGLASLSFLPIGSQFVLHFMVVFVIGIVTFQRHVGLIDSKVFGFWLVILTAIAAITLDIPSAITALITSLTIAFVEFKIPKVISFIGTISYSIYLIHEPIGVRIISFGNRFAPTLPLKLLVLVCAVAATICAAYIFYLAIERPAKTWSASLKYSAKG